jgi:hypothetical protein
MMTEGDVSGALVRRTILLLAAATVVTSMVVATAAPAIAAQPTYHCTALINGQQFSFSALAPRTAHSLLRSNDTAVCTRNP